MRMLGRRLTHGSLFAGIGGFDLGFERAGFETVWQVEIDEYCRRVLEQHFPRAERFRDIRECGTHNLKRVDVISGGFPCQDISVAGKRAGIDGSRSGLWSEMRRIIRELRPSFVVVENVSALLYGGIERVAGDLATGGYDSEWDCLPASAFGANHERDRVFIVAYASGQQHESGAFANKRPAASILPPDSMCSRSAQRLAGSGESDEGHPGRTIHSNYAGSRPEDIRALEWWAIEPNVGRVAHGVPRRVDRLRGLGNAVVPQIAQWIAERIKAVNG